MGVRAEHLLGISVVHMSQLFCDTFLCNLEVSVKKVMAAPFCN